MNLLVMVLPFHPLVLLLVVAVVLSMVSLGRIMEGCGRIQF